MSFMTCCVPGCTVSINEGVLHRFPNPNNEKERFRRWVEKIGSPITEMDVSFISNNRRVCRRHFEAVFHYPKNRLCKLAIPTLLMPGLPLEQEGSSVGSLPEQPIQPVLLDITNLTQTGVGRKIGIPDTHTTSTNVSCDEHTMHMMEIPGPSEQTMPTDIVKQSKIPKKQGFKIFSKKEIILKKSVLKLKADLRRTRAQKNTFKKRLAMAVKAFNTRAFDVLTQKMSKVTKTFLNMQVTQAGKKYKGRRFTLNEKVLALSLYKASPKAYRLLSEICILPKRKTLQSVLQKLNLQPGINKAMMRHLKKKVSKLPESHKYCTVIFDEMAIAPSLNYDSSNDKIVGFVDDGENREETIADHVLVFMVRGIVKKFKQPIAYTFCTGSTKTHVLKKLIKNVIEAVESTNLKVIATVCDQGATNVAAINALINDTKEVYARKNEEWRGGFFKINECKIFPIYDPPHLIKGVRNNLLNKNLMYKGTNGQKCIAKWEHIIQLYNRAPGYRGVRLVPKLSAYHVMPNLIPKMRVKHSTQVFSSSVGVALGYMADEGILPAESKETADVLLLFDKLFDSVNGSFSQIRNGKIFRTAVTRSSPHNKLWRDSLPILKTMKFVGRNEKSAHVPSLSSWIKTIEGFQLISNHMNKLGVNSLLLRQFNQDPLENFFGAVRAHGCSNIMPTALGFQAAYKTLLVNNMVSAHSVGANCENDKNKCLHSLKYLFKEDIIDEPALEIDIQEEHLFMQPIDTDNLLISCSQVDREKCAAIGYCSGWLIKTAKKNIFKSCTTCRNDLESDVQEDFHKFIKVKEYSEKGWLCYPKREVFNNFTQIEYITNELLKTSTSKKIKLFEYLDTIISIHIQWDFVTCGLHKNKLVKYLINKNISFCIRNWCKEINNIVGGKQPLWDQNDPLKVQAFNHMEKHKLRKRVRQTGVVVNV